MAGSEENQLKGARLSAASDVVSHEMSDDQKLMLAVVQGDKMAFQRLYEKFRGPILSYTLSIVKNQSTAQDLTQETFLRVYRYRDSYRPTAKFSTWLWTIARNCCFDYLRTKGKQEMPLSADVGSSDDKQGPSIEDMPTEALNAEALLVEKTDKIRVRNCLEKIPLPQREALTLRTISELTYEEIAEATRQSLAAIKSLIYRAKQSLIDCLQRGDTRHG